MTIEETNHRTMCTSCEAYREDTGCRLMRPCCRKEPWKHPYCPMAKWFPVDRFTEAAPSPVAAPPVPKTATARATEAQLKARGIAFTRTGNRFNIDKVPKMEMDAMAFFGAEDTSIPGGRPLQESYRKELATLEATAKCTGCAKGRLMRKYLPSVRRLLQAQAASRTTLQKKRKMAG